MTGHTVSTHKTRRRILNVQVWCDKYQEDHIAIKELGFEIIMREFRAPIDVGNVKLVNREFKKESRDKLFEILENTMIRPCGEDEQKLVEVILIECALLEDLL